MADNSARIAEIETTLANGASSVTTPDGTSVSYDLDQLRKELRRLRATDDTYERRRPVASRINLQF